MNHRPSLRFITPTIRGLLILVSVLAIPKLASSEADTDQDAISSKQLKVIHQGGGYPQLRSLRLFAENKDCAVAKLDIWLQHGTMTYSASPDLSRFRTAQSKNATTTMLIGGKDCLIRVRIQPVPGGTSIDD